MRKNRPTNQIFLICSTEHVFLRIVPKFFHTLLNILKGFFSMKIWVFPTIDTNVFELESSILDLIGVVILFLFL